AVGSAVARALGGIGADAVTPLIVVMQTGSPIGRCRALEALGHAGKAAEPALPRMVLALKEYPGASFARAALRRLGPVAVPQLLKELRGFPQEVQCRAAELLGDLGPQGLAALGAAGKDVEADLKVAQNSGIRVLRATATLALYRLGLLTRKELPRPMAF